MWWGFFLFCQPPELLPLIFITEVPIWQSETADLNVADACQVLSKSSFINIGFPKLEYSVVLLAVVNGRVDAFLDYSFIHSDLQVILHVWDVISDHGVHKGRLLIILLLGHKVLHIQDVLQVVEDVEHVVTIRGVGRFDCHTIHTNHFVAIVHHCLPSFQVRSCKKRWCFSR